MEIILDGNYFYLIMEYIPFDLSGLIKRGFHLSDNSMLSFAYQLLSSVKYLHSNGIIHRDIKSSNVLLTKDGKIKLVDFGLSREKCKYMTNRVCTLWYRAPELLLGSQNYDERVDSWSIGCILLELRLKKIPFKGNDEVSQIRNIFTQLGSPKTQYIWSEMLEQSDFLKKEPFSEIVRKLYSEYFDEKLLTILTKLLNPDPIERMTPAEVLSLDIFGSGNLYNSPIESEILNELNFNQKPKL
ncbi:CMGC/CDK/CRK7 protein kinase [Anncaliia algerae PRA109]|nr:CMGC/CDK/CRK7 protein kinase [Anncaliia algerae PRA109]